MWSLMKLSCQHPFFIVELLLSNLSRSFNNFFVAYLFSLYPVACVAKRKPGYSLDYLSLDFACDCLIRNLTIKQLNLNQEV